MQVCLQSLRHVACSRMLHRAEQPASSSSQIESTLSGKLEPADERHLTQLRWSGDRAARAVKVWAVEKNLNAVITLQQMSALHGCFPASPAASGSACSLPAALSQAPN